MNRSGKFHALLSTARVANVPSVISNVWLGVAIGVISSLLDRDDRMMPDIRFWDAGLLILAGICLYVCGNFLNDWMDRSWDAEHRPERALPRGLFRPSLYLALAVVLALAGVAITASLNWRSGLVGLSIVACIVIYTVWHKRKAWSVIPMGLCRALLPALGAFGIIENERPSSMLPLVVCAGLALLCYIAGLSLSARSESSGNASKGTKLVSLILLVVAGLLMGTPLVFGERLSSLLLIAPVVYFGWFGLCQTRFRNPVSRHVSALLAGIPLLDWIFLLPVLVAPISWNSSPLHWDAFAVASGLTPLTAFFLALLLQRLAPAT